MAYYKLYRSAPLGKAVPGHLYLCDPSGEIPVCRTLENADFLIPALIYTLCVTRSPRFKRPMPLVCNVPGRAGIRIHPGTRPEHSKGCILVPSRAIEQSITTALLQQQQNHETIKLEII